MKPGKQEIMYNRETVARKSPNEIALDALVQELKRELFPVLSIPKRYLTEGEASHYLGLSVHSLRQWRSKNTGPNYLRIGARIVYDVKGLDAWMKQHQVRR